MTDSIFYLLETSVLLVLLYSLYFIALRKETFFQFNRYYLLVIILLSLLSPFVRSGINSPDAVLSEPMEKIGDFRNSYYEAFLAWEFGDFELVPSSSGNVSTPTTGTGLGKTMLTLVVVIYFAGILACLSRTAWTLRWIMNTVSKYPVTKISGLCIVTLPYPTTPFSFFNYVFIQESVLGTPDYDLVIAHERIHAEEKHSIDSLFVQLAAAIFWFNPVIWQLLKSLKATHEYIADHKIVHSGYSATAYQILLLRQLISNDSRELVHNFNLSFIKQRIAMMKHKKSGWAGKLKAALTIVIAALGSLAIVQCNSRVDDDHLAVASKSVEGGESIKLPVLPASDFRFKGDLSDAPRLTIVNDRLYLNGNIIDIDNLSEMLDGTTGGRETPLVIAADIDQRIGFLRRVDMALRKLDRRKLLYLGSTSAGDEVEVMLVLPPDPEKVSIPDAEQLAADGKLDLLKIYVSSDDALDSEQTVYKFVNDHIAKSSQDYVVSIKTDDTDSYGDFLLHTYHVREAFHRIYQERAHKLFGKDFFDTSPDEYKKAREGVPMSISIAEG